MKSIFKTFALLSLVLACGVCAPNFAAAQQQIAAPRVPAPNSLEIQISAPVQTRSNKRFINLDPTQPRFSVVLRNASDKPFQIHEEWNSGGCNNVHLEITEIDGKVLAKPLIVEKGMNAFFRNFDSTETLAPNQVVVREIYLHVPAEIQHPETPTTQEERGKDAFPSGHDYWHFR